MLAPTIACLNPDEEKIDSEFSNSVENILYAINTEVNAHERMFKAAQMKFAHAQTKEETMEAFEDMRTHAIVHDTLKEDMETIKDRLEYIHSYHQQERKRISGNQ